MKKLLSIVLALSLCLTAMMGCFVVSAETNAITAGDVEIVAGNDAVVTFTLATEGISAAMVEIAYTDLDLKAIGYANAVGTEQLTVEFAHSAEVYDSEGKVTEDFTKANANDTIKAILNVGDILNDKIDTIDIVLTFNAPATGKYVVNVAKIEAATAGTYDATAGWTDEEALITINADDAAANVVVAEEVVCDHANAEYTLVNVTETAFEYTATCPDCSKPLTKSIAIGDEIANISSVRCGKTIKPENDISLHFHLVQNDVAGYTDFVMVAKKQVYASKATEATIDTRYLTDYEASSTSGLATHLFIFSDVAGYEMSNAIDVKIYGLKDGEYHLVTVQNYSVVTFFTNMYGKTSTTQIQKDLYVDMANYGAAVQQLGEFNLGNLANSWVTPEIQAESGTPETEYPTSASDFKALELNRSYNTEPYGTVILGRTLAFESKVNLVCAINLASSTLESADNLYCKIDYYTVAGGKDTAILKYDGYVKDGYPSFKFDKAPISTIDYPLQITAYYGDPNNGGVELTDFTYSFETFFANQWDKSSTTAQQKLVYQTTYAYGRTLAELAGVEPYTVPAN